MVGQKTPDAKTLEEIADQLAALTQSEEESVDQRARQIAAVALEVARADTFVKLAQQEAALGQMLRRFAEKTNTLSRLEQMEVRELAHRQRGLQGALHDMLKELPALLAEVPDEPEYQSLRRDVSKFLEAVASAKIEEDLATAVTALEEPDAMTGYAVAAMAAKKWPA